jgi:undecaprenyl-phosphate galactose phosphotransferase
LPREIGAMGDYYNKIIKSKPGITGMWQTSGRNRVGFEERLKLDEYYFRNWSLWLDIVIIVKTIKIVALRKGAY